MSTNEDPIVAAAFAAFDDPQDKVSAIKYDVPLPGAYTFERVVPLDVPRDWFVAGHVDRGRSFEEATGATVAEDQIVNVDVDRLKDFFDITSTNILTRPIGRVVPTVPVPVPVPVDPVATPHLDLERAAVASRSDAAADAAMAFAGTELVARNQVLPRLEPVLDTRRHAEAEAERLTAHGEPGLMVPTPGVGGGRRVVSYSPSSMVPRLALIETYTLASFLGDYGLGRTLQTFSLLPGEKTTISVDTWRSSSTRRETSSSIFDSADTSAQDRFTSQLEQQTGSAFQDQGGWAVSVQTSASAGANFGIVSASASLSAGFSANHQEARQQFTNDVARSASEHSQQVNTSREQSVRSTGAEEREEGSAQSTVRELSNTNLRRVLNFVFRELNQVYRTVVTLRHVRLAFYNGRAGGAEIVPLAEAGRLLGTYLEPAHHDEVAAAVLRMAATCVDGDGTRQTMLERGVRQDGGTFDWDTAEIDAAGDVVVPGGVSPLDETVSWRISEAPIGQDAALHPQVPGVVTHVDEIVLRTDNIVVEALLGRADALDPYATALQALDLAARRAEIAARQAETAKLTKALTIVDETAAADKAAAFEKMLVERPDIALVAASGNGS